MVGYFCIRGLVTEYRVLLCTVSLIVLSISQVVLLHTVLCRVI